MTWNPAAEPFRVTCNTASSQRGCYGWASGPTKTFSTLEEARTEAERLRSKRRFFDVTIHRAENADTWLKNGRWKKVN